MKQPRQLTAYAKTKAPNPNGGPRSGYELVDRRGFVRLVGSMATAPQNDAGVADLRPRYEEFDVVKRYWIGASSRTVRTIESLSEAGRKRFLAARVGLLREVRGDQGGIVDGEAWHLPGDYDLEREKALEAKLAKALRVGLLSIGGRTYKLRLWGSLPHDGPPSAAHNSGCTVYSLTRAAGTIKISHEALLLSIEQGSI